VSIEEEEVKRRNSHSIVINSHSIVYNPLPNLPPGGKEQQPFPPVGNGKGGKTTNDAEGK